MIDDTPNASAHVPERFRHIQWTRLRGGEPTSQFIALIKQLLTCSSQTTGTSRNPLASRYVTAAATAPAYALPRRWSGRQLALILSACAVMMVAVGYFAYKRLGNPVSGAAITATQAAAPIAQQEQSRNSIAVLPFADLSERHDQQYLADGIAEQILDLLARIPELKVIGRTSSFSFRGTSADLRAIGTALGATYVLEGSVRRSGEAIRVTAQLLDTRDGSHRWSETFERNAAEIFGLQDAIAARTAYALNLTMAAYRLSPTRRIDPDAYDDYVRGQREVQENTEENLDGALALFNRALSIEPNFYEAAIGAVNAHLLLCDGGWRNHKSECDRAKDAANAAIAMNRTNPDGYAARAEILMVYDLDWSGAQTDIRKATELGGGEFTEFAAARLEYSLGRMDEAREHLNNILSRSPFDANAMYDLGLFVEYRNGRFVEAENWLRRAVQISPHFGYAHLALGQVLLAQGRNKEALEQMQEESDPEGRNMGLALVYYALGMKKESNDVMDRFLRNTTDHSDFARLYAYRRELDKATAALSVAYDNHDPDLWYIKGDWLMSSVAEDPRYKLILRKMKLPSE